MKFKQYLFVFMLLTQGTLFSQERDISDRFFDPQTPVAYPKRVQNIVFENRNPLQLPDVEGYLVLKCDFHLHTVFSDGSVWPTTRVEEAFREGLDVISITDHLEFHHLNEQDVHAKNLNREYEIAKGLSEQLGILLIPGAEITREVPAGHFNVLFLEDANLLEKFINYENHYDPANLTETLQAAKDMGCFIFWNHPSYQHPSGIAEWYDIHEELYRKGLIMGVEVANSNMYIPLVQKWAEDKKMTMFSNSDYHHSVGIQEGSYRPMTFVFVKERSMESIREALSNRRTIAFAQNYLYGDKSLVNSFFLNSLKTRCLSSDDRRTIVEISNLSGLPFDLELLENESFTPLVKRMILPRNRSIAVILTNKSGKSINKGTFQLLVHNIYPSASMVLQTEIAY